jgi:tetratricopeptide (TPR) repeat protein
MQRRFWVTTFAEQIDAAIEAFERAMRLSPLDALGHVVKSGLARAHLTAGRYGEAMRWVDQAIVEQPRFTTALRIKVVLCAYRRIHRSACDASVASVPLW